MPRYTKKGRFWENGFITVLWWGEEHFTALQKPQAKTRRGDLVGLPPIPRFDEWKKAMHATAMAYDNASRLRYYLSIGWPYKYCMEVSHDHSGQIPTDQIIESVLDLNPWMNRFGVDTEDLITKGVFLDQLLARVEKSRLGKWMKSQILPQSPFAYRMWGGLYPRD